MIDSNRTTVLMSKELRDMIRAKKITAHETIEEVIRRCMFGEAYCGKAPVGMPLVETKERLPLVTNFEDDTSPEEVKEWYDKYIKNGYERSTLVMILKGHKLDAPEIREEEAEATQKDEEVE